MVAAVRSDSAADASAPRERPHGPQHVIVPSREAWGVEYPFASRWFQTRDGTWMHYIDEGPRDAPVVVMLHGNPTWSFYWRKLVVALRESFRCIAPDHMGCGLSDRPQAWPYQLAGHVDNVHDLLAHAGVEKFSLAVHDWGGAIGMGVATRNPARIEKLIVTNTAAFLSTEIPPSIASVRIPVFGRIAVLRFNAFAAMATFRAVERALTPNAKAGLIAPYSNPKDRIATLRFVEDIPMKASHPSWKTLEDIESKLPTLADKPMVLFWGDKDFCFTPSFRARWQQIFPAAEVNAWNDAGHYVIEDAGDRLVPLAKRFLSR